MEPIPVEQARLRVRELEKVCSFRPTSLLIGDLAACYFTIGESEKAYELSKIAWEKNKKQNIGANLGIALKDLGRHDESLKVLEEAFWIDPSNDYIRMGYAEGLLKAGHWKQAWPLYDNARQTQIGACWNLQLPTKVREWQGEDLPKDHLLFVINEGGQGDRISYARWLPELTKRGVNWKFYPFGELFSFFERIFPRERLVADGDTIPDPTHWTTTFALPAKLNVGPGEIPSPLPFTASPNKIEKYKFSRTNSLPTIGLCYKAAEMFQGGRTVRSLSEGQAMRLVVSTCDQVNWVNLQYGEKLPLPVTNLEFPTWEDTAGLVHNLDAIVTVDTSIMHLAGSMGKPTAVLLPGNACWKFLRSGKKLRWYPSATFYRNQTKGFEDAINDLIAAIRNRSAW